MTLHWLPLLLGVVAAAANVCGGMAVVRWPWQPAYLKYFIALAAGFMLATSLLEMFPESYQQIGSTSAYLLLSGYLIIHFFEHTLSGHFHFGQETHTEQVSNHGRSHTILFGLIIHAFVDGISIATGFLISNWLGWMIFIAVFLHKMPEGFAVSSVMLASGSPRRFALMAAGILGAATLAGVIVMMQLHTEVTYMLPIAAGVSLYVAASDLIPEVNQEPSLLRALVVFVGVLLFVLLKNLFR